MKRTVLSFLALTLSCAAGLQPSIADEPLTIGSKAPALDIEHWIHEKEGTFPKVTQFEDGKVYIVEFWATWCGPCIASMPHIVEIQNKYAEAGVQFISISDEKLEVVEKFLERKVSGDEDGEQTYGELTKAYSLTTDPDESAYEDYMRAAGQGGIPTAFIVGKTGHVEWIGHPMAMDKALQAVVEGDWDREAFAAEFRKKQMFDLLVGKIRRQLGSGNVEGALEMIDEAMEDKEAGYPVEQLASIKFQVAMSSNDGKLISRVGKQAIESSDSPVALNRVTWTIYQAKAAGREVEDELLATATEATAAAVERADSEYKGYLLDTLAHLHHVQGDLDAAIQAQKEAVATFDGPNAAQLKKFLRQLRAEKKAEKEGAEGESSEETSEGEDAAK